MESRRTPYPYRDVVAASNYSSVDELGALRRLISYDDDLSGTEESSVTAGDGVEYHIYSRSRSVGRTAVAGYYMGSYGMVYYMVMYIAV